MDPLRLRQIDSALWPIATAIGRLGSVMGWLRPADRRPLILRPGGMGDLILLCVAVEELGYDLRQFFWVIERRSSVWARHLELDHMCYDNGLLASHWDLAGRFSNVVNSEQRFGLSQATALLACRPDATLTCFSTNRAAPWAHRKVGYDADARHEVRAFEELLAGAMGVHREWPDEIPRRSRRVGATERPIVGLSGFQSEARRFNEEEWERFIRAWIRGGSFWIASSEVDRPFARALQARFAGQADLFEGGFNELCDLIQRSAEVFTVDGGFVHIASYYGVPVTAVFTSGRDRKWAPVGPGSRIVRRRDLSCQPCTWFGQVPPCPNRFACKEIGFEQHIRNLDECTQTADS